MVLKSLPHLLNLFVQASLLKLVQLMRMVREPMCLYQCYLLIFYKDMLLTFLISKINAAMQPRHDIYVTLILVILLIAINLKPILLFREWLYFRIKIIFKQYINERKNNANYRL